MNTTGPKERISDVEHRNKPQLNNIMFTFELGSSLATERPRIT